MAKVLRDSEKPLSFEEVASLIGRDVGSVAKAALWLSSKGLVSVEKLEKRIVRLGEEGRVYAEQGLPERRLIEELKSSGGRAELNALKRSRN